MEHLYKDNTAQESHREKIIKAKNQKFKEPKKKRRVFISEIGAEFRTNKTVKKCKEFYNKLYPMYNIKID